MSEILLVASYHGELVYTRRRRNHRIFEENLAFALHHSGKFTSDPCVYGYNLPFPNYIIDPVVELYRLLSILAARDFGPCLQFGQHDGGNADFYSGSCPYPG